MVTALGRLTSQFLIDPVVAAGMLATLGDLPIPSDPDDAERRLLATLAGGVPDLGGKALLAATVALARPDQLAAPGDVEGVPVGELSELADQLVRYLGWLGALQLHSALDWQVPVATDRPSSVLPMIFTSHGWQTVEPAPQGRGVPRQPGAAREPRTAWDLLASYRAVAPLPSQD